MENKKETKQNRTEYCNEYNRLNKKRFSTNLNKDEYYELDEELKKREMNKAEFLRWALKELKNNPK